MPPPVALIFRAYVPAATVLATANVAVLEPAAPPVNVAGENDVVTPAGIPVTEKETVDVNPC
jgi:hypothetical protein